MIEENSSDVTFFNEVDLNDRTGAIRSDMPAWYFDVHIDEMRESISRKKGALERGEIAPDQVGPMKEEIKAETVKLEKIEAGKPKLSGTDKDNVYREYENLGKQIRESLPTHREMTLGLNNPREELVRQKSKHISISHKLARACGVKAEGKGQYGKISGDEANKCYKIFGKALGESTNVEKLRREGHSEAQRSMNDLTNAILAGKPVGKVKRV